MTPDPIFTVGGSPDKFDKEHEGLNTALPLLDANSSLSFSGWTVLGSHPVSQAAMPPVLPAALLDVAWVSVSGNECGGGRIGFCPRLPSLFQKFDGTVAAALLFRCDRCFSGGRCVQAEDGRSCDSGHHSSCTSSVSGSPHVRVCQICSCQHPLRSCCCEGTSVPPQGRLRLTMGRCR